MDPGGGAKKFLYTGTKRQTEEEEQWSFGSKAPENSNKSSGVPLDMNDVWSIQRNVSLGGMASRSSDRLTHNASKSFYSRHGGMKVEPAPFTYPWRTKYTKWSFMPDGGSNSKVPDKAESGSSWAPARVGSYSYSYAGNSVCDDTSSIASSRVSRGYHSNPSPRRFDSHANQADENDF